MNPSQSKNCEGSEVCADDPLPIHLRRYAVQSSEDPTGWNVGIVDGGIGEASVSVGGVFHTEILGDLCASTVRAKSNVPRSHLRT